MFYSLGVLFDQKTKGVTTEFGPVRFREALNGLYTYSMKTKKDFSKNYFDLGDIKPKDRSDMVTSVIKTVNKIKEDGKPIIIGGEHSVTYAALESFERINVVQFDAHLDLMNIDSENGKNFTHATFMRRAVEKGFVKKLLCLGIRDSDKDELDFVKEKKIKCFSSWDIKKNAAKALREIKKLKKPIYVTIDIDVLDPCYAPNVYSPIPNGLNASNVLELLNAVRSIEGFDIVEIGSFPKSNNPAAIHAAFLLREFLSK